MVVVGRVGVVVRDGVEPSCPASPFAAGPADHGHVYQRESLTWDTSSTWSDWSKAIFARSDHEVILLACFNHIGRLACCRLGCIRASSSGMTYLVAGVASALLECQLRPGTLERGAARLVAVGALDVTRILRWSRRRRSRLAPPWPGWRWAAAAGATLCVLGQDHGAQLLSQCSFGALLTWLFLVWNVCVTRRWHG